MGDIPRTPRSLVLDLHSFFGISKNASFGKVYKSLIRWHPDKSSPKPTVGKKQEIIISDPIAPLSFEHNHHQKNEDHFFSRHSILSRSTSTRSKTPTHSRRSLSRNSSRRCTTPTPKSNYRSSETEFAPASLPSQRSLSRNSSRRCTTPTPKSSYQSSEIEFAPASLPSQRSLSRNSSRRCTTPTTKSSYGSSETEFAPASLSRNMSRRGSKTPSRAASLSRNMRRRCTSETEIPDNSSSPINMARNYSSEFETLAPSLSRNISYKGSTPIIFSQSSVRRKPPPVEKKLECTLEELCFGGVKKIKLTRDVILNPGILAQEEEILMIEVKPGWRKGTKITFEGKGDEKPGYLPADIVFRIDEKQHPLFKRDGDNLEMDVEIPLVNALTGCAIPVPIIGGETMTLSFEDTVIYPGYEKVIRGQGMPNSKQDGRRGDLHIQFLIHFPTELSDQQREEAVNFLQDCY